MPVFQFKARTLEGYLAGIGAGGALIAGGIVVFVVLVGIVTFDAWPRGAHLLPGPQAVTVDNDGTAAEATGGPSAPNLVRLLGRPLPATASHSRPPRGTGANPPDRGVGGGDVVSPVTPTDPAVTPGESGEPSAAGSQRESRDVVGQTVSGLGNAVEGDTTALGEDLGGSDSLVGGVVQGAGKSLNATLQALAGSP